MTIYVAAIDGMTSHDAGDVTSLQTSLISQEGVVIQTGSDLQVAAQDTPDMTIKVSKGSCYVLRDSHVTADNSVRFWKVIVTATTNVSIPSSDASNPRIDLICVKIDTGASPDATASNVATLVNVEGTAAASPSAPSIPNNHLKLAEISVPALDTTIESGQITDYRTYTGLVMPYSSGYRLTDTAGNLEGQLHEDSSGRVIMRSSRSGGEIKVDPTDDTVRIKGREDEVNEVAMKGSVASSPIEVQAQGTDTNIGIDLKPKGSGIARYGTSELVSLVNTKTLTNKRLTKRITTIVSHATPTVNTDNCDLVTITAQAVAITSMTTNLSGTPTNGQTLIFRILDDGTGRAITWGAKFQAMGVALPTTTTASKVLSVGFIYDTVDSKWGCVASVDET